MEIEIKMAISKEIRNKFIENFFSLASLRLFTIVVPIITFPYLVRVLGSEKYGLVMWAWSIINFFILFVNFGFGLSVTKYIAIHKNNKEKISEIISTTLLAKIILFILSLLVFISLIYLLPKMQENRILFMYTFLFVFGEMLMPLWYFQGIEEMKYTAIITAFIKIFFTILVFLVIKKESDFIIVPLLYASSSILSALFAYYIIYIQHEIRFKKTTFSKALFFIKDSVALFMSSSISVIKDSLTILFVEHFLGLSAVAFFDIAQKYVNILITPFHIISSVLYPFMAKTKNFNVLKQTIAYTTLVAIIFIVISYFFDSNIVQLIYGKNNNQIRELLNILVCSIIFSNLASLLGTNGLVVVGKNNKLFLSSLFGMILYLVILIIFVYLNQLSLTTIAIGVIVGYAIDALYRYFYLKEFL